MDDGIGTIRRARLAGPGREAFPDGEVVDLFLADGRIADIAPEGALPPVGRLLDADGGWLIPGLWDHHVHAVQWALAAERVPLSAAASAEDAARIMGRAEPRDGRRVGNGFRDGLWPDAPTLDMLDAATGSIPTYLINADVHSVWLNSAALAREGFSDGGDGMLREEHAFEISRRLNAVDAPMADAHVARMAREAAARGVVGMVDFEMAWNEEAWMRRAAAGFDALRVRFGIYPQHLERALAQGLRTGDRMRGDASELIEVGPVKVITDGSLGTRTAACSHPYAGEHPHHGVMTVEPSVLTELMTTATAGGLECAVHAIGDVANSHALDGFALSGASGTIEHAQLVAHADVARFARLGVGASVQPEHAVDDRDMADAIWARQTAIAYPLRALADGGANLLFGSDAPVTPLDPWAALAAAVFRTRDGREPWHPEQSVNAATALAASTRGGSRNPARVAPGAPADLAICARDPLSAGERSLRAMEVQATLLGGRITHQR